MSVRRLSILIAVVAVALVAYLVSRSASRPAAEAGGPMVAVKVPELGPEQAIGEAAFKEYCASCHGVDAAGQEGVAPPLIHRIYEPGHHGDQAFAIAAQLGVTAHHWTFGNMPPVEGVTLEELSSIVTYVRALQRANGID